MSVPPPIPGPSTDPEPKSAPDTIRNLDEREGLVGEGIGVGYRAFNRFSHSRASLLAAGTTYYIFFAMFSIVALAYGIAAALGADRISDYVTEARQRGFPWTVGSGRDRPESVAFGGSSHIHRRRGRSGSTVGAGSVIASPARTAVSFTARQRTRAISLWPGCVRWAGCFLYRPADPLVLRGLRP